MTRLSNQEAERIPSETFAILIKCFRSISWENIKKIKYFINVVIYTLPDSSAWNLNLPRSISCRDFAWGVPGPLVSSHVSWATRLFLSASCPLVHDSYTSSSGEAILLPFFILKCRHPHLMPHLQGILTLLSSLHVKLVHAGGRPSILRPPPRRPRLPFPLEHWLLLSCMRASCAAMRCALHCGQVPGIPTFFQCLFWNTHLPPCAASRHKWLSAITVFLSSEAMSPNTLHQHRECMHPCVS